MTCSPHYCTQKYPKRIATPWMTNLKDILLLSELTIPGTHDSACLINFEYAQTQTYSITSQLEDGIRFLDIRCRHITDIFVINHGPLYCGIMFGDVLNECMEYLNKNPGECIVMRVKEEYTEDKCTRTFQETFKWYYEAFESYISLSSEVPKLGDVRGKIWMLMNFTYGEGYSWDLAEKQDDYVVEFPWEICQKVEKVKNQIFRAISGDLNTLFINFCSGTGILCPPFIIAEHTNKVPMEYSGRMGIVIMDFPGEDAVQHLIDQNTNKLFNIDI